MRGSRTISHSHLSCSYGIPTHSLSERPFHMLYTCICTHCQPEDCKQCLRGEKAKSHLTEKFWISITFSAFPNFISFNRMLKYTLIQNSNAILSCIVSTYDLYTNQKEQTMHLCACNSLLDTPSPMWRQNVWKARCNLTHPLAPKQMPGIWELRTLMPSKNRNIH